MARYRITFVDEVTRIFFVEAASLKEAEDKLLDDAIDGDIHEAWEGKAAWAVPEPLEEKPA